jgi:DnaJ family protein C protein 17
MFMFMQVPVASAASTPFSDFESLVMMRLRQAEERKRLAQEMAAEDEENK